MTVISVASSHHTSTEKTPSVAAQLAMKGDHDRQADERHHAGLTIPQLTARPVKEDLAAVDEDRRANHGRDPARSREGRRHVAEPVLHLGAPDDDRKRQQQDDPELAAEHVRVVASMLVVGGVAAMPALDGRPGCVPHRGGRRDSVIVLVHGSADSAPRCVRHH